MPVNPALAVTIPAGSAFHNHLTQMLDFTAGEVQFVGGMPPGLTGYAGWTTVSFNHCEANMRQGPCPALFFDTLRNNA